MSERRRLIVVSNRGPVTYSRDESGRVARRGGGGLVTALAPLVSLHDVTWIANALSDEDRAVAAEAGGAFEETGRDGSRYRLRLVGTIRPTSAGSTTSSRTRRSGFCSTTMAELVESAELHEAWESYGRVNATSRTAVLEELEREPDAAVWFHDYHLYLAPAIVRARAARCDALALRPHPLAEAGRPGACCRADWRARAARGPARERRRRLPHATAGASTSSTRSCRPIARRASTLGPLVTAHPISVDPTRVRRAGAERRGARREARELERIRCRAHRAARRPHGSVEEHRPRLRAFGLLPRAPSGGARRVGMLALLDPSRQDIPQYAAYLAAIERAARAVNERFGGDGWMPIELEIARRLPALGRRVQAVRRAARERDLRRDEPRREGGAARQRA